MSAAGAVGALGLLAGGVRTDRRARDLLAGVDRDVAVGADRGRMAVHAARGGSGLLLADAVVLRAVALALEPLAGRALRHAAAEVGALLAEDRDALSHRDEERLVVDQLGRGQRLCRIVGDPGAGLGRIEESVALLDAVLDRRELAYGDQAAEAALARRPQEADERGGRERDDADAH